MKKLTTLLATLTLLFFLTPSDVSAVACSEPDPGSSHTLTESCAFSRDIDGLDAGSLTIDQGVTLTINSSQVVVWPAGQGIVVTGSIQNSGGSLVQDELWAVDADNDNYTPNTTLFYRPADKPANTVRVSTLASRTVPDCDDTNASVNVTCYSYSQGYYYGYSQSRYWRYGYGQSWYYGYGQSWYYGYSQGRYWRYGYGQSRYWRYGYSQCFPAGTKVLMADGSLKNIEEVKAGDQVVSYDLKTGERVTDTVHKLLVHKANPEGFLVINNNLRVTPNHRMWVENKNAWLRADELSIGDKLLNPDGEPTIISTIEKIEGTNDVFNLSLPGKNHNYFADGVLVHNAYKI